MKRPVQLFVLVGIVSFFVRCGGTKFEKARDNYKPLNKAAKHCEIEVFTKFPQEREYKVIGRCFSSAYRPFWWSGRDGSKQAYRRLKKCACKNGGNAIVITDKKESIPSGYNYYPDQFEADLFATVIFMQPD